MSSRKHRSSSLSEIFSRILPSSREERDHKLRETAPEPESPPATHNDVSSTSKQMFDAKKTRREQRRSLKESGDYIGVQGANPRTGYPDPSASSTETSNISDETKRRLDQQFRDVEEQKKRLHEAELKHQADLSTIKRLREARKKDRAEKKKAEDVMMKRRLGRWKPDRNGWSSVVEPHLSPIVQS